jgi:excisionase family DNA binding protein
MNVAQACERLNVSPSTLYGWVWQRRIPFVKIGRCLRFEPRQLEEFIASNGHPQLQ